MQGEEESTLRPVLRSSSATEGGSMSPVIIEKQVSIQKEKRDGKEGKKQGEKLAGREIFDAIK
jgi:hypothetical protein